MAKAGAGFLALLIKLGPKLLSVLAKLLKTLKVGKVALAATSFASYSYLFTWQFATAIIALLLIHESGHIWMMKRYGMKTKGIYLIPFLGGAAVADKEFPSRKGEADIALMGPIWGFGITAITAGLYVYTDNPFFAAAAGWMAMVNLLNMLPINPLDGGRIMKSIIFSVDSKLGLKFLAIGLIFSALIMFKTGLFIFALLLVIGALDLYVEYKKMKEQEDDFEFFGGDRRKEELYAKLDPMTKKEIVLSVVSYALVVGILWYLMYAMNNVPEVNIARQLFMS